MRGRGQQPRGRRPAQKRGLLFDVGLVSGLIVVGGVALYIVVFAMRPDPPDPAAARERIAAGNPPPALNIATEQDLHGSWRAWWVDQPTCALSGYDSEREAKVHLGLAIQLGQKLGCAAEGLGADPNGTLPPEGWYRDPRSEMGDDSVRWWDGQSWTAYVWSETHWGDLPAGADS